MPVLRIQDLVVPKRPPITFHYFNGSPPKTSDILWLPPRASSRGVYSLGSQPARRDPEGVPSAISFLFPFQKTSGRNDYPAE